LPRHRCIAGNLKYRQTDQTLKDQQPQQAELARLKHNNARLDKEAAFLKKRLDTFKL
jgi:cell division protein FtsB